MSRLQLALDGTLEASLEVLSAVHPYIDIAEIGTPLIYREGMNALRVIRAQFPQLALLADLKIMDAGEEEASIAFEAGASYVTVLGVTQDKTIEGAVRSAQRHAGQIVVDMMQVVQPLERGQRLIQMGCDLLCLHTAYDLQSQNESPYSQLAYLNQHIDRTHLAIAGGIHQNNLSHILPFFPAIIVVGGAITRSQTPAQSARNIREAIETYANQA